MCAGLSLSASAAPEFKGKLFFTHDLDGTASMRCCGNTGKCNGLIRIIDPDGSYLILQLYNDGDPNSIYKEIKCSSVTYEQIDEDCVEIHYEELP